MNSRNMNYFYNVEYFSNLPTLLEEDRSPQRLKKDSLMVKRNHNIMGFCFPEPAPVARWSQAGLPDFCMMKMYTTYPGLLAGVGYAHDLNVTEAIKMGFSFDYVTGLPYIPGSSMKGTLRSYFPGDGKDAQTSAEYEEYIRCLLAEILAERGAEGEAAAIDIENFKENIFESGDIFMGAYPINEQDISEPIPYPLMREEFSNSYKKSSMRNVRPVRLLKVRAGVPFAFCFQIRDYSTEGGILITAAEKIKLFQMLLQELGIGARVSSGYGRFTMQAPENGVRDETPKSRYLCQSEGCNSPVARNRQTGIWYRYCLQCMKKYSEQCSAEENGNAETV